MMSSSPPSNFDIWMFGPGTVLGSKVRVYDVLFVGLGAILFAILLILVLACWRENSDLQNQIDKLKEDLEEHIGPVKRALDNSIGVFELREAKGTAHGYPSLDSVGKIPTSQLPKMTEIILFVLQVRKALANQFYQFNITWTDNVAVDTVYIEHNYTGSSNPHNDSFSGNLNSEYFKGKFSTMSPYSSEYIVFMPCMNFPLFPSE